jgi:MGT family glycosyltransferase
MVERGHTVMVLAGPTLVRDVEATGASFRQWRRPPVAASTALEDNPFLDHDLHGPAQLTGRLLDRLMAGPASDYATDTLEALDTKRADAVVSSSLILGAVAAAESRGVPCAALLPNAYVLPAPGIPPFGTGWRPARGPIGRFRDAALNRIGQRLWDRGLTAFNQARAQLGLAPLQHLFDQLDRAERLLVLTSAAFDFPGRLPANVRYVGAQLDDPVWVEPVELPAGEEPLVLVGLSSTFMDQSELLRRIVGALARLPVRAVVTTGPQIDPQQVPGTDRVRVVRSAPHSEVLRDAAVVVTHGGHGTVIKALAAGVPTLILPMGRDQPDTAARAVAAGAGLRLRKTASIDAIATSMRRLLDEPQFRHRAGELGALLRADAAGSTAVDELEAVADNRVQPPLG